MTFSMASRNITARFKRYLSLLDTSSLLMSSYKLDDILFPCTFCICAFGFPTHEYDRTVVVDGYTPQTQQKANTAKYTTHCNKMEEINKPSDGEVPYTKTENSVEPSNEKVRRNKIEVECYRFEVETSSRLAVELSTIIHHLSNITKSERKENTGIIRYINMILIDAIDGCEQVKRKLAPPEESLPEVTRALAELSDTLKEYEDCAMANGFMIVDYRPDWIMKCDYAYTLHDAWLMFSGAKDIVVHRLSPYPPTLSSAPASTLASVASAAHVSEPSERSRSPPIDAFDAMSLEASE